MIATRGHYVTMLLLGLAAAGCSDSNDPDTNAAPTANFAYACTDLECTFTNLSSDSDGTVATSAWDFGDDGSSGNPNPTHAYATAADFQVTLTVADDDGEEGTATKTVSVTEPEPGAPVAGFTVTCFSLDCTFTDDSEDSDGGTIVSWAWEFGDGATSDVQNPPSHHYAVTELTQFTARLTVTDDDGLTSTKTANFTVSPSAHLTCNGVGCVLTLEDDAVVTVTLESRECTAENNTFRITEPAEEVLITNGCYEPEVGTTWDLNNGEAYLAGTMLNAEVISGSLEQETAPALRVLGAYPEWTLQFDDGEDATPPEPDFNDLVITITATPVQQ
ncbi:MAG: PKD domain-containing protein [Gemmatimonadales bacterium]